MRNKILLVILSVAFLGTLVTATPVQAGHCCHNNIGTAIGAFAIGALFGHAITPRERVYQETVYVQPCYPACYEERVYVQRSPRCYTERVFVRPAPMMVPGPTVVEYYY